MKQYGIQFDSNVARAPNIFEIESSLLWLPLYRAQTGAVELKTPEVSMAISSAYYHCHYYYYYYYYH